MYSPFHQEREDPLMFGINPYCRSVDPKHESTVISAPKQNSNSRLPQQPTNEDCTPPTTNSDNGVDQDSSKVKKHHHWSALCFIPTCPNLCGVALTQTGLSFPRDEGGWLTPLSPGKVRRIHEACPPPSPEVLPPEGRLGRKRRPETGRFRPTAPG